ncbi:hypothetical protein F0Q34_19805 [Pseudoroseomonas oryzae]|uniref:Uncharacterized protein n=1 Tax=Teichococcus oryzae TaxID=1608942 RepID=A0A5B2TAB0_9PROT|nr:hypothetical protein F0Q34_19805 [Pseudoroseomonas oryzae]
MEGRVLGGHHGSATTTAAVRRAMQHGKGVKQAPDLAFCSIRSSPPPMWLGKVPDWRFRACSRH